MSAQLCWRVGRTTLGYAVGETGRTILQRGGGSPEWGPRMSGRAARQQGRSPHETAPSSETRGAGPPIGQRAKGGAAVRAPARVERAGTLSGEPCGW